MAGTRKPSKPGFENMNRDETRKYYAEQMARAQKRLEEDMKRGDEKSVKHTQEIIRNLEGMMSRL